MAYIRKEDRALVENILNALDTNPKAVIRAIKLIGEAQTVDELDSRATLQHNNVGFSATDAAYGTWLYSQIQAGVPLSDKALNAARKLVKKYARTQLLAAAKTKLENGR